MLLKLKVNSQNVQHTQFSKFSKCFYDSTNMSRLVQILRHDLIRFYKHVQTCSNIMIRFDTILQTCPDLFKYHDIYKHVQTCSNITIRFDTILQTCLNLFKYYDMIWYNFTNMSRLVHDIMIQFDTILHVLNMSRLV